MSALAVFGWRGMRGKGKGRGREGFNHLCLGVFLSGRVKDLRGLER
jgi:hypothetical protein